MKISWLLSISYYLLQILLLLAILANHSVYDLQILVMKCMRTNIFLFLLFIFSWLYMLWQLLVTKTNSSTNGKSLKVGYLVGSSHSPCYILMSSLFLTQDYYMVYICSDIIFQILLLFSRPMMSHHVTCHVTKVSHAFFIV